MKNTKFMHRFAAADLFEKRFVYEEGPKKAPTNEPPVEFAAEKVEGRQTPEQRRAREIQAAKDAAKDLGAIAAGAKPDAAKDKDDATKKAEEDAKQAAANDFWARAGGAGGGGGVISEWDANMASARKADEDSAKAKADAEAIAKAKAAAKKAPTRVAGTPPPKPNA